MKSFIIIAAVVALIWAGAVSSISFLEAWMKFRAPGVTLPVGLGIGKLVFSALNRVEIILALIVLTSVILSGSFNNLRWIFLGIVLTILILQTLWLLPSLVAQSDAIISGRDYSGSSLHIFYVIGEFIKVPLLIAFGVMQIRSISVLTA